MKLKRTTRNITASTDSYKYFTKHGLGPGTLPKDVKIVDWEDVDNYVTAIWLDRPLSTVELTEFDVYPETSTQHKAYSKQVEGSADPEDPYRDLTEWVELDTKTVKDFDGFITDYTLYTNGLEFICMFGDKDLYEPNVDYADYITENEDEAYDWFYSYEGFVDDEDIYSSEYTPNRIPEEKLQKLGANPELCRVINQDDLIAIIHELVAMELSYEGVVNVITTICKNMDKAATLDECVHNAMNDLMYELELEAEYAQQIIDIVKSNLHHTIFSTLTDNSQDDDHEGHEFEIKYDDKFGEPSTEVFTVPEFNTWMKEVIDFE